MSSKLQTQLIQYQIVIYELTQLPSNGALIKDGGTLSLNDTFTQEDVNNNLVSYTQDGSEVTFDSFSFTVSDGSTTLSAAAFEIVVTPVNDAPMLQTNGGLTVDEDSSSIITTTNLRAIDDDNSAGEIIYEISKGPTNGVLDKSGTDLGLGDTFTQEDVDNDRIRYAHDGSETTSDSFSFQVSDGEAELPEASFHITVIPVGPFDQTITFDPIDDLTEGSPPISLTASASSGLTVVFSVVSGPATIDGVELNITGPGLITIKVSQDGDDDNNPVVVEQSFCSNPEKPVITVTSEGISENILQSSTDEGNQWFRNATLIPGATEKSFGAAESGIYTIQITVDSCMSEFSDAEEVIITGLDDQLGSGLTVYPNPSRDKVHFVLEGKSNQTDLGASLFTINGVLIEVKDFNRIKNTFRTSFDVSHLIPGIYLFNISGGKVFYTGRFEKE